MKVSITETNATTRELNVAIPQSSVSETYESKLNKYRKEISLKGFRPGKLPKKLVEARYGAAIRQEAVEETVDRLVRAELEKSKIFPVTQGKVEDFKDDGKEDITFKMIVEVDPEIDIADYQDLGVSVESSEVSEDELAKEIEGLRKHFSSHNTVDRASVKGDIITGDYLSISLDGETQEIPENPEFKAEIGASSTPSFDDGLLGLSAGDEKEISFDYAADHKSPELAGKSAIFKIKVKQVAEISLPEVDEDFAKKLGAESVEQLKERILESLKNQKENEKKTVAYDKAIDILIEKNPFEVPQARIENYVAHIINRHAKEGEAVAPTEEQIEANRENAVREIKKFRILEDISGKEKIKVKQADVDARIEQMAAMYGMDFQTLKASMRQSGRIVNLREELKIEKTLDYLVGIREE